MRRLLMAEWWDAHAATTSWTDIDEIGDVGFLVKTVGWELEGHGGHLVLAQSLSSDGQVDHVLAIPKGMLHAVTVLAVPGTKNP